MKNSINRIVKYGIFVIILAMAYIPNVNAEWVEVSTSSVPGCEDWIKSQLKSCISVSYTEKKITNKCSVTWKITKINNEDTDETFGPNQSKTFTQNYFTGVDENTGLPSLTVVLENANKVEQHTTDDSGKEYKCVINSVKKTVVFAGSATGPSVRGGNCDNVITQSEVDEQKGKSLNCDSPKNEFEKKFCEVKASAQTAGHTYDMNNSSIANVSTTAAGTKFKDTFIITSDLQCAYDVNDTTKVPLAPEELKGEDYFVNKQSFYAEHIQELKKTYVRYYSPCNKTNIKTVTCKRVCAEAVIVEYGPPVAKKAGMCFEYRVRVTSRVDCHADLGDFPTPPECDCTYCTPTPICYHTNADGSQTAYRQGGPNNDYDACVQECDGGQYSKKCSNKCYKKVYANKSSNDINSELLADQMAYPCSGEGSLDQCKSMNSDGCYYRYGSSVRWSDTAGAVGGRWYRENSWGIGGHHYVPDGEGFFRAKTANGLCHDDCSWEHNCRSDQYLNPNVGHKDCELNNEKWKNLIKECNQQATCNTTTAYYTIGAGYNDTEIIFPRGATDKITDGDYTKGKTKTTTASQEKSTLLPYFPEPESEHNGIKGCYNHDRDGNAATEPEIERLYRTTWGFPATWMNAKTGEISYDSQDGQTGWGKFSKKFCIPFDQKGVNSDWWNLFYNKHMGELGVMTVTLPEVQGECVSGGGSTVITPKPNPSIEKWNINAHTRKFGWFEWNFDIKCFYATNPKPLSSTDCVDCNNNDTKCDPQKDNVRVRSVDLENMFPASDGSALASPDTTGRTPGFNWSQYATQTKNVNETFQSEPAKLISYIQNTGYKIYDDATYRDKYLDYKFVLTPSVIRSMRGKNDGSDATGNYTGFAESGFFLDENGVQRYYSSKIRSLNNTDSLVPDKKWLKCNNLGDYRTGCYTP